MLFQSYVYYDDWCAISKSSSQLITTKHAFQPRMIFGISIHRITDPSISLCTMYARKFVFEQFEKKKKKKLKSKMKKYSVK